MSADGFSVKTEIPHVEIYTDGAREPNPGPGGFFCAFRLHPISARQVSAFEFAVNLRLFA